MPASGLLTAKGPNFTATAEHVDRTITAVLTGSADLTVKKSIDEFLATLHERVRAQGVEEVIVDFSRLAFLNSSCLKAFVTWICVVQDLPAATQYRIVLISSPEMTWQQRSLRALSCLAAELVSLR